MYEGGWVLCWRMQGNRIVFKETLFLTDLNYAISCGDRLFSVSGVA